MYVKLCEVTENIAHGVHLYNKIYIFERKPNFRSKTSLRAPPSGGILENASGQSWQAFVSWQEDYQTIQAMMHSVIRVQIGPWAQIGPGPNRPRVQVGPGPNRPIWDPIWLIWAHSDYPGKDALGHSGPNRPRPKC